MQQVIIPARPVAVALAAAVVALPVLPFGPAPATAASCATGGVSVVVDFNGLGPGGVATGCVAGGGGDTASALFAAAGHELTRAQRQPGFVCRVDAVPSDDPCVNTSPASAYWGLWWSDGKSGDWTYSSLGVDSLEVPAGGSVAFSWDDVQGSAPPSVTPSQAAAPSASPSGGSGSGGSESGGSGGGASGSTGGAAPSSSPSAAASPTAGDDASSNDSGGPALAELRREKRRERADRDGGSEWADPTTEPTSEPTTDSAASASTEAEVTADPAATPADNDGLPVWVAPLAVLVLAAAAGVTVLLRRRSTT